MTAADLRKEQMDLDVQLAAAILAFEWKTQLRVACIDIGQRREGQFLQTTVNLRRNAAA